MIKKILSLLLLSVSAATLAQAQITVTYCGQEVNEGDVITIYAANDEFDPTKATAAVTDTSYSMDPMITTTSTQLALSVTVVASANAIEDNAQDASLGISWCGIGTECAFIKSRNTTHTTNLGSMLTEAFMNMHAVFARSDYKTYTAQVTISARNGLATEKLLSFTEAFVYDEEHAAGIHDVSATSGVKLQNRTLSYNFATAAPRTLQLYSLDGRLVRSEALAQTAGSISLTDLPRGLYVYRLQENGKNLSGTKIVLK